MRKIILICFATAFFGGVSGFVATLVMNDKAQASSETQSLNVISQGITAEGESLSKVDFKNKIKDIDKTSLPFKNEITSEQITSLVKNEQVFHKFYMNKSSGNLLELQVTDADIVPMGDGANGEGLIAVKLNGKDAQYYTNGAVEILFWKDDGLSYSLTSSTHNTKDQKINTLADDKSLGAEEMVKIASSMK
ncbi:hypothetical protein [Sporosarcina koreensis]|uniref:hypothetical protein n=1 Tax=Sporosarcina koreensis TaxID=334735 RepID=UPI00075EC0DA|nr:hypothetical protein [Sporosarcina koreensis]